eukprot:TRINITY_DN585_c0_g1_i7.p1 TRINITY_DN585_c0_g1~~TRINITY_DN585_c0_g1_i7.p1  ORF type:complete len:533 (-),score=56.08 TRINITY_DN585_c0_g1_i7:92-1690(-)
MWDPVDTIADCQPQEFYNDRERFLGHDSDAASYCSDNGPEHILGKCEVRHFRTNQLDTPEFLQYVQRPNHFFYRYIYNTDGCLKFEVPGQKKELVVRNVLDLYCGAGGLGSGFAQAGFNINLAVDCNVAACETYRRNHPQTPVKCCTVATLLKQLDGHELPDTRSVADKCRMGRKARVVPGARNSGEDRAKDEEEVTVQEARELAHQVDLVLAGPPCQGVSRANINRIIRDPLADERNSTMLRDLVEIVRRIRPALLLCENVCSILDKYVDQLVRAIITCMLQEDMQVQVFLVNPLFFGVPQNRWRIFLWMARVDVALPPLPIPTSIVMMPKTTSNQLHRHIRLYTVVPPYGGFPLYSAPTPLPLAPTVHDAISDLPDECTDDPDDQTTYACEAHSDYQRAMHAAGATHVMDHAFLNNSNSCEDLLDVPLPVDRTLPPTALPPYARKSTYCHTHSFPMKRVRWQGQFATVRGQPKIPHPSADRVLSIREHARAQSFPDSYEFCGTKKERYVQIGNAVPPMVALAIARTVKHS